MADIYLGNYQDPTQNELFARDVQARIEELKSSIRKAQQSGEDLDEHDVREYDALVTFRDRVESQVDRNFEDVTIVPDDSFADYARDYAESLSNIDHLATYVDWDAFANALKADYTPLVFGDETVHVR